MTHPQEFPTKEKRLEYAKIAFAFSSHERVADLLRLLISGRPTMNAVEVDGLSLAITTLYFSPFKGRPPFKLSSDIIPSRFKHLHSTLELVRDKVDAHRDYNLVKAGEYSPNDVEFEMLPGRYARPVVYRGALTPSVCAELLELVLYLLSTYQSWMRDFVQTYLHSPPPIGFYRIDLESDGPDWFQQR